MFLLADSVDCRYKNSGEEDVDKDTDSNKTPKERA